MATLTNTSNRPITVVLDHPAFRTKEHGYRVASQPTAHQLKNRAPNAGAIRRAFYGSLRLSPGQSVHGLHDAIAHVTQVRELAARRPPELVVSFSGVSLPPLDKTVAPSRRRVRSQGD